MVIRLITRNKKQYLPLLLMADEQENMIDRYLEQGDMYLLYDEGVKAVAVVVRLPGRECELKNIAVEPRSMRKGYGRRLVEYLCHRYAADCSVMWVGTGDVPSTVGFYSRCGFLSSHRAEGFFTTHYDHPIYEDGVQLVDMLYLRRDLGLHP